MGLAYTNAAAPGSAGELHSHVCVMTDMSIGEGSALRIAQPMLLGRGATVDVCVGHYKLHGFAFDILVH